MLNTLLGQLKSPTPEVRIETLCALAMLEEADALPALTAMWSTYVLTGSRHGRLAEVAIVALALEAYIAVLTMGSPTFNTQLGVFFWTLVGAVHGATLFKGDTEQKQLYS